MHGSLNIPRITAVVCCAAAAAVITTGVATGHSWMAVALAAGLLIGAGNAYLAQRFVEAGVSFTLTSLARLTVLTATALVVGLFLGFGRVYLVVGGLALSQFVLVAVAFSARRQQ
ncbi:MAG: hypothetical protein ABR564_01185 [Candidatus Dormibacteria bacterium]